MARDSDSKSGKSGDRQLGLPLRPVAPPAVTESPRPLTAPATTSPRALRVITGEGKGRDETLRTRDDVARLLMASAADMFLKRISVERAHEIEVRVERAMRLFDRAKGDPVALSLLRRELDDLEQLWREGKIRRKP